MEDKKFKIKELLREHVEKKPMKISSGAIISEDLQYHIDNEINLTENVFMLYSQKYFDLINEVRNLWEKELIDLNENDLDMVQSDLGKFVMVEGEKVYLDAPFPVDEEFLNEAVHRGKKVNLNKPFRTPGGPKKFAVYVKTPKGTIKKVTFGDPNMRTRTGNKKAVKSFAARHKCSQKKDKTTAGYWACRVPRFSGKNKSNRYR
jgi:hypothetical protein